MTNIYSGEGISITQKNLSQIIVRGKGDGEFAKIINNEISLLPPSDNLRLINNDNFILAKQSFDQWSLIVTKEISDKEILKIISNFNDNDQILASDYSMGQVYFEFEGDNKIYFLNKLTHFDLREKKFQTSTMAQTLIARIDCSIYNLNNKFLITTNRSFEEYFKDRINDTIDL